MEKNAFTLSPTVFCLAATIGNTEEQVIWKAISTGHMRGMCNDAATVRRYNRFENDDRGRLYGRVSN